MSTISKHFGLKYKEESYIFKELEKVRQVTKKDFQQIKQKLASKPAADEGRVFVLPAPGPGQPGKKSVSPTRPPKPSEPLRAKGPANPAAARPRGPSGAAAPGRTPPFCPQDFYLRSSAFLRHQPQRRPPVIASGAGTSRPLVPMPPPEPRGEPGARRGPRTLRPARGPPARTARGHDANRETAALAEAGTAKVRKGSPVASEDGDTEAVSRRGQASGHTPCLRERAASRTDREGVPQAPQPVRAAPTSRKEVVASLQSQAQLASDQTVRELIQCVLGRNRDAKMEDICSMGKMYWHKTSQVQAEQGLQESFEEPKLNMLEELPGAVSSIFQIEQEDILECRAAEVEFKLQETLEVQPADESSKPLEDDEQPKSDLKAAKQVKSSEVLHIRGKEVKRTQKSELGIPQQRQRKSPKSQWDQNFPKKKIPQDSSTPTLHDLCTTVPARELPIDLCLASRVYHTADKKGHNTLLGIFGTSFLGDPYTDEEQRHRILQGIPVAGDRQDYVAVLPTIAGIPPEMAQGTGQHAHKPCLQILGEEVSVYPGLTKLFWNLTSPKFSVPLSVMKETLYPKYESVQASRILIEKYSSESKESITLDQHSRCSRFFFLRKSASFQNIQKCFSEQSTQLKRVKSAVELRKEETIAPLEIKDDIQSNIKEVMFQKAKELEHRMIAQNETEEPIPVEENVDTILDNIQNKQSLKDLTLSLIEASRKAGISYIVYPPKKKMKWKKGLKVSKLSSVYDKLSRPPKLLKRSMSHGILPGQKKYLLSLPVYERIIQCPSLPSCLNFDKFVQNKGGIPENNDPRTWVLAMFSKEKQKTALREKIFKISTKKELSKEVKEPLKLELSDSLKSDLPPEVIKYYESEVEILTEEINNKKTYPAFAYGRRGAIYRKLGKLQSAMNDLQEAIHLEPFFLNVYWHRHLIYLFQDKIKEALEDLNYINKYNKKNAEAYLSRAEIFRRRNNIMLAILNYTQAIKCKPMDADTYFRRGEMCETANRVLAIDDFSKCIFYDPQRTDALLKRGIFYYENENWISAIQDFTALLNIDLQNSQARTFRGRAYFKQHFYKQATQDLSAAIHLDPNNWLALYYRGCLFRKSNPLKALQDYSVSALINDGYENLGCFLHRGILYADLKLWLLAICDFETVISLERNVILAYINIGLIHLLYLDNYVEAIRQFSEAIRLDPLYIQSYVCRAETYHKLHKLKRAVRELSCAIHLQPDGIQLYIIRGQYLLLMKCYDLAKFTIYQVAGMNKGLTELSPVQQALIYSFCENHDKAIQILDGITLNQPDITIYTLLAKAQMKAKKNKEAVRMFKKALDVFSHSDKGPNAVADAANCLYNLGLCYMEEGNFQMAFDSFTKAVKANPDFAESFYQRGLCKVKLHKESSILDFNHAITLDPKYYQAYLSRVAFYGSKGRYSKAILNCNEAIKIFPQSVCAHICRGVLKYCSKTYKLAIVDLTTAINMDKNSYIAFYNRALCYTKINELQMALRDYGIVLLLDAGETVTLNTFINRGLIYVELEQYSFALEDFKRAALISRTNVSLCQATAMCYHRNKEFEQAVDFFTWALKINPSFLDAYIGRGNSYMEYGHEEAMKQAQKDFMKALHFNPTYTKARISLGYNLQAQGKFQKAWNHFTIAVEIDPKSYLSYEGRAIVCLQMGDNFAAIQDINAAIKINKVLTLNQLYMEPFLKIFALMGFHPHYTITSFPQINTTAEFLTNRGVIHEFLGQQQNAMRDYQAAISLNPTYSLAYFNAGNVYFHHRQFSQAREYFSKALKFDPENECAAMNRAIVNTILKQYKEAREDFAYVAESCPFWAAVYFNRAHFYCCLKQYELAEEDLNKALSLKPNDALAYNLRAEVRGKIGVIEEAMADYNQALDLQEYASVVPMSPFYRGGIEFPHLREELHCEPRQPEKL